MALKLRKPGLEYFKMTCIYIYVITTIFYTQKLYTKHNALLTRNPFLQTCWIIDLRYIIGAYTLGMPS